MFTKPSNSWLKLHSSFSSPSLHPKTRRNQLQSLGYLLPCFPLFLSFGTDPLKCVSDSSSSDILATKSNFLKLNWPVSARANCFIFLLQEDGGGSLHWEAGNDDVRREDTLGTNFTSIVISNWNFQMAPILPKFLNIPGEMSFVFFFFFQRYSVTLAMTKQLMIMTSQ